MVPSVSGSEADSERKQITGRAGIVALGTLFSRLLGLARDMVLAAVFSRAATDAWLIAWQLPNILRQLLAEGAMQTAVLPVLSQIREAEGEEAAARFYRAIRGLSLCVLVLVSLLGVLFAPTLVALFASGFRERPDQFARTVQLTRWVFPYIFFMGTAALGMAALNTHRRFVVTSFAPALLNISFLVAAFALPGWLGARGQERILAMALGGLAGGALQVVAQWPSLKKIGYLTAPSLEFSHPAVKEALRRLAPTLLGIGVYGLDVMVGRRLLSTLDEGAVTYFSYALRLCDFSQGIFIMALSTATLPTLASFVGRGQLSEVASTFAYSVRLALFVGVAATALSLVLAEPLVVTVFERGKFSAFDSRETATAFMAQGAGIFLVAAVRQMVIVFFALGQTKTPVYVAIVDLLIFAALGLGLREKFGHVGVSLAVTGARIAQFALLWVALRKHLPTMHGGEVLGSFLKSSGAALVGGGLAWASIQGWPAALPSGFSQAASMSLVGGIVFAVTFLGTARLMKSEELDSTVNPIFRRLRGKRR